MYAPHTVTVYNVGPESLEDFSQTISATILEGVFLDAVKASNVRQSGLESADSVQLFIPFSVAARDAVTGERREYASPKEYADSADGRWTLQTSDCFFVKGAVSEVADFQTINRKYDDVYRVTKVDEKDFGSLYMQHWEVGGA